jgi:predicted nucleotidyltransferase
MQDMPKVENIPIDILNILKEYFSQVYQDRLERIILFGSRARGDQKFDSDIDILVVLKGVFNYSQEIERTGDFISSLSLENNVVISRAFVDLQTFLSENSPFLLNVKREGIVL